MYLNGKGNMKTFLKASEAPQSKLRLKKAILNGSLLVFVCNMSYDNKYTLLENKNTLLNLWSGLSYSPACLLENEAYACIAGYYYKFKYA